MGDWERSKAVRFTDSYKVIIIYNSYILSGKEFPCVRLLTQAPTDNSKRGYFAY